MLLFVESCHGALWRDQLATLCSGTTNIKHRNIESWQILAISLENRSSSRRNINLFVHRQLRHCVFFPRCFCGWAPDNARVEIPLSDDGGGESLWIWDECRTGRTKNPELAHLLCTKKPV